VNGISAAGTNYTVSNSVAAIDNKGILVNNTISVITMEEADVTHNGIVTTAAQTFGGVKTFSSGIIAAGTNYLAAASVVATNNNGIIINNVTSTITLEEADAT
jgi:hypothetical protein